VPCSRPSCAGLLPTCEPMTNKYGPLHVRSCMTGPAVDPWTEPDPPEVISAEPARWRRLPSAYCHTTVPVSLPTVHYARRDHQKKKSQDVVRGHGGGRRSSQRRPSPLQPRQTPQRAAARAPPCQRPVACCVLACMR
jgi:hypothetical protein